MTIVFHAACTTLHASRPQMADTITAPALPKLRPEERTRRQPPYNVVLLNDDDHTFEYVITMLQQLFGYPREKGFLMACEVDATGRVILLTTTKEHAELKRDQIHAFGPDPLSSKECKGSMSAIIEPAMD
jgi:ATP-dependent Clp protease adaptor protein ClpS